MVGWGWGVWFYVCEVVVLLSLTLFNAVLLCDSIVKITSPIAIAIAI